MRKSFLTISSLLVVVAAWCCMNESRVLLSGKTVEFDDYSLVPRGHGLRENKQEYERELVELDSLWRTNRKVDDYSDYGVKLVYLGRYAEAKAVFAQIEKRHPGRYATAANIGTVYELLGQNDSALYWIKRAVQINPGSHYGSEWLHVRILEAKVGGNEKINAPFLIGTDFGTGEIPASKLDSAELIKLRDVLYFQLNERVSFVGPKDTIVGLLLFELGNITALTNDVTTALRNYDRAIEYGYESEVMKRRYDRFRGMHKGITAEFDKMQKPHGQKEVTKSEGSLQYWVLSGLLLLGAALVFWMKKNS